MGKNELMDVLLFYADENNNDQGKLARQVLKRHKAKQLNDEFNHVWNHARRSSATLKEFTEEQSHRKQANSYAREDPTKTGYITFPMSSTGGRHFYRVSDGRAEKATAFQMFLEVKKGILDWWNYK